MSIEGDLRGTLHSLNGAAAQDVCHLVIVRRAVATMVRFASAGGGAACTFHDSKSQVLLTLVSLSHQAIKVCTSPFEGLQTVTLAQ